ncbi:MAG: 4Fe-4S dicluster domain-containing protein [Deferrisomatales bacterium]|nr:4Fe-4S dicluster domain-containing protein [Deferrisomatales bacterium]
MSDATYRKLAKHLDELPGSFPATDSGVELRILRRLFTPEQAELAVHLTLIPEAAPVVARRAGISTGAALERLTAMAREGLIYSLEKEGSKPRFMAAQFVVGIWEYHVNSLDEELVRDVNEYLPQFFDPELWRRAPQLRTVPVGRSLKMDHHVLAYEQAEAMVRDRRRIVVAPCICRREHKMQGAGCDRPEEACLIFDGSADYYLRNGLGREIGADEAREILEQADRAGLVLQPSNSQKAANICCCCGCCCQVLKNVARQPRPAEYVSSAFRVTLDADACVACGVCPQRCPMGALTLAEGADAVALAAERCIGCGLCVSTCPVQALALERKPEGEQPEVPATLVESVLQMARARGKLGPLALAATGLRSKFDRLLAGERRR